MNLENLNLVDLNAFDTVEVNGGELPYTENAVKLNSSHLYEDIKYAVKWTLGNFAGLRDGLMSPFN
jgi:hypothetical protein